MRKFLFFSVNIFYVQYACVCDNASQNNNTSVPNNLEIFWFLKKVNENIEHIQSHSRIPREQLVFRESTSQVDKWD